MSDFHTPVMLKEVLKYLDVQPGKWYLDCNLGGGGHTQAILKAGGKVIGIDLDQEALDEVKNKLGESENLILVKDNFVNLDRIVHSVILGRSEATTPESDSGHSIYIDSRFRGNDNISSQNDMVKVAGILFDLGVSSHQMDEVSRGFSFSKEAPLDMRMDTSTPSATAADLVNGLHEGELTELFLKLGEESFAKLIARKIVEKRKTLPINTTVQLAQIVVSVKHKKPGERIHPATQVFQALRIAVNDELNNLKEALPKAFEVLEPRGEVSGGRLVVISFHSLEDRIVKEFFKSVVGSGKVFDSEGGAQGAQTRRGVGITKKPLEPSKEEVLQNPRSRSAKLRVIEKL